MFTKILVFEVQKLQIDASYSSKTELLSLSQDNQNDTFAINLTQNVKLEREIYNTGVVEGTAWVRLLPLIPEVSG